MSIAHIVIDGIDIFFGSYDDIDNSLSPEQTADVNSLSIDKRRRERALTYTLINYAATSNTNTNPNTNPKYRPLLGATIHHHHSGAPYLSIPNSQNALPSFSLNSLNSLNSSPSHSSLNPLNSLNSFHSLPSFSLSHCRSGACIALGCESNLPIGIDIEDYSDKLSKVKSKFINKADETALNTLITIPRSHLLLIAWTIKEAAYKAAAIDNLTLRDGITLREITLSPNLLTPPLTSTSPTNSMPPFTPFTPLTPLTSTIIAGNLHLHCTSLLSPSRCISLATQQTSPIH